MDLTPNIAPAIADAMAQLKQMIPEDLKQAHDALADLEDKLMAAEGQFAGELAAELTAAGQKLLGADSAAALLNGQELTIGPITIPPFTVRLGKASAS